MSVLGYADYRDSGVPWIGAAPSHWDIVRLRRLVEIKKRIAGEEGPDVLSITQRGIKVRDTTSNDGQLASSYAHYQLVEPGDFAMNHMDLLTGWVDIAPQHGVTSPDYRVFSVRRDAKVDPRYLLWVLQLGYIGRTFFALGQGSSHLGRWRLPSEAFNDFEVAFPPLAEQIAIAAFLDRETGKIDALVEAQQRLIALLKEKRQSFISRAVTKGLDPTALMKDSGVEWLGEVPAHWQALQLGRLCRQVSDGPHFSPTYVDDGVMFLSARNVRVDGWSLEDAKFISEADYEEFCRRVTPEPGDILYTKGGTTGIARVVDLLTRFQVWVHIAVLKLWVGLADPHFVAYALNSTAGYEQSQLHTRGATNQDLGLTRMIKIWLALPPIDEQRAIVAHLEPLVGKIDLLSSEAASTISLLNERRSAMISAAVTGKIDVRGLVPDQAEAA